MAGFISAGAVEVDVHGMTVDQAAVAVDSSVRRANNSVNRIRVIHGYHGGTAIRDMVRSRYRSNPKVRRIENGPNPGSTDLVLRELY